MKNISIAYLCNQKQDCNSSLFCGKECKHTLDIQYAKNFALVYEDEAACKYIETDEDVAGDDRGSDVFGSTGE